jgi:hypothetical protein
MLLARLHHILRGLSPVEVVDCDVGAFLGERYAYDFAEAAVGHSQRLGSQSDLELRRGVDGERSLRRAARDQHVPAFEVVRHGQFVNM